MNSTSINGNTPLSQIGCNELLDNTHEDDDDVLANLEFEDDDSNSKNNKKSKRGILPKQATNIMKQWLFQHIVVSVICFFIYFELILLFNSLLIASISN